LIYETKIEIINLEFFCEKFERLIQKLKTTFEQKVIKFEKFIEKEN